MKLIKKSLNIIKNKKNLLGVMVGPTLVYYVANA